MKGISVIPAQAGIHDHDDIQVCTMVGMKLQAEMRMDSRLRGNDELGVAL